MILQHCRKSDEIFCISTVALVLLLAFNQARRQDSVAGGAREVYLCEFEKGEGGTIYSSVDQTNKVKTKKKKRSSVQKFS